MRVFNFSNSIITDRWANEPMDRPTDGRVDGQIKNRSPKGSMWSATFVHLPSVCPLVPPDPLRPEICPLSLSGPKSALLGLKSERAYLRTERTGLRPERLYFRPERADFRPERDNFKPERADFMPERADFMPERAWGGLMDGCTDVRTDAWTNKSPPVF